MRSTIFFPRICQHTLSVITLIPRLSHLLVDVLRLIKLAESVTNEHKAGKHLSKLFYLIVFYFFVPTRRTEFQSGNAICDVFCPVLLRFCFISRRQEKTFISNKARFLITTIAVEACCITSHRTTPDAPPCSQPLRFITEKSLFKSHLSLN